MIRVMIVDDEPLAQEELVRLIGEDSQFEITSTARNGKEALSELKNNPADVIFLDIEMPGLNGLEVASILAGAENPPHIVFATAYHQYAMKAFDANAIDYLLKPYDPARLKKTLDRVKQLIAASAPRRDKLVDLENDLIQKGLLKKLVGHKKNSKDRIILDLNEILYFYVEYATVFARIDKDTLEVNSTLKDLIMNLDPAQFAQTHKSYIVNLNQVEKVSPMFSGNFELILHDGDRTKIPLSRRYAKNLKSRLKHW